MTELMRFLDRFLEFSMPHLVAVPILVPMLTAALMLLLDEKRRRIKSALSWLTKPLPQANWVCLSTMSAPSSQ